MDRQEKSGVSSVGRAARPVTAKNDSPVQIGALGQNEIEVQAEKGEVHLPDQETKRPEYSLHDKDGNGEALRVGGSNPSHLTNPSSVRTGLPATFTPEWLADDMVSLARIYPGMRVLEPSAGRGSIVRSIQRLTAGRVTAVELNGDMIADLRDTNAKVLKQDFLKLSMEGYFDRVVMNPPKDAVPHVIKAMSCLERGGRLVALVHGHVALKLVNAFPAMRYYKLPQSTFVDHEGGYCPACIVMWAKP